MFGQNRGLANKNADAAVGLLNKAIAVEDDLNYIEPADWYLPARETLGMAYLRMGKAGEAEKAFRADLEKNRRNPRSLFGLSESLKAQGNAYAAQLVELEFQAVWRNAEGPMRPVEEW